MGCTHSLDWWLHSQQNSTVVWVLLESLSGQISHTSVIQFLLRMADTGQGQVSGYPGNSPTTANPSIISYLPPSSSPPSTTAIIHPSPIPNHRSPVTIIIITFFFFFRSLKNSSSPRKPSIKPIITCSEAARLLRGLALLLLGCGTWTFLAPVAAPIDIPPAQWNAVDAHLLLAEIDMENPTRQGLWS